MGEVRFETHITFTYPKGKVSMMKALRGAERPNGIAAASYSLFGSHCTSDAYAPINHMFLAFSYNK